MMRLLREAMFTELLEEAIWATGSGQAAVFLLRVFFSSDVWQRVVSQQPKIQSPYQKFKMSQMYVAVSTNTIRTVTLLSMDRKEEQTIDLLSCLACHLGARTKTSRSWLMTDGTSRTHSPSPLLGRLSC
jgi:hypothetical protein